MSNRRFGRLPTWWARGNEKRLLLTQLKANESGTGIAAMKCLLAIAVLVDFYSLTADVSLTDFEKLTNLSRPMVVRGVSRLEQLGIVIVQRGLHTNRFTLTEKEDDTNWAKVPVDKIKTKLKEISNRGIAPFTALKLYLTMLQLRYKANTTVRVMHETLRDYTGIQTTQVRSGLDVLYSSSFIHLMPREDRATNEYQILGL
jgi:hypothetical protein